MNSDEIKSGINTLYHVSIDVPEITLRYLRSHTEIDRAFERQIIEAFRGSAASGSYEHDAEQWADFDNLADAEKARSRGVAVVADFTAQAQFYKDRR